MRASTMTEAPNGCDRPRPVALAPIKHSGVYYHITYSKELKYLLVEKNGSPYFRIIGTRALYWIGLIERYNAYDVLMKLLKIFWKQKSEWLRVKQNSVNT